LTEAAARHAGHAVRVSTIGLDRLPLPMSATCANCRQRVNVIGRVRAPSRRLKTEVDSVGMALRLGDTKTGKSIRPVGSAVMAVVKAASGKSKSKYVFPANRN